HELLADMRVLTNLDTSTENVLHIVLSGQPQLELKLREPKLRQLRQRITLRYRTTQLSPAETRSYIEERLRIAGANRQPIVAPEAIESIHHYACGVPRVINVLCDHALINAFAERHKRVSASLIHEVAREFELHLIKPIAPPFNSGFSDRETGSVILTAMAKAAAGFSPTQSLLKDFTRREDNGSSVTTWVEPEETKI